MKKQALLKVTRAIAPYLPGLVLCEVAVRAQDSLRNLLGIAESDVISCFTLFVFTSFLVVAAVRFINPSLFSNPLTKKESHASKTRTA